MFEGFVFFGARLGLYSCTSLWPIGTYVPASGLVRAAELEVFERLEGLIVISFAPMSQRFSRASPGGRPRSSAAPRARPSLMSIAKRSKKRAIIPADLEKISGISCGTRSSRQSRLSGWNVPTHVEPPKGCRGREDQGAVQTDQQSQAAADGEPELRHDQIDDRAGRGDDQADKYDEHLQHGEQRELAHELKITRGRGTHAQRENQKKEVLDA